MSEIRRGDLLPCPFCGGEPQLKQTGKDKLTLKCLRCLVRFEQRVLRFSLEWLEDKMVENWNKRI